MNYRNLITVFTLLVIPGISNAETKTRTVTATGRGEVFIAQTIANIQLSISENGKSVIEAQNKTRIKSAKLLSALKAEKTLNMETTSITVNPILSYTNNKPQIIGYNANYSVQVKSIIENAGTIIDHAIVAGASVVDEPKLSASDEDIVRAEKEAIKIATLDAKSKAEASLSVLGFRGITVSQITVQNNNNRPGPVGFAMMKSSDSSASATPTQIVSGKTDVTAEVSLAIEY